MLHCLFLIQQENRINRLQQAAEIFLLQIIEAKSQVGIVTFNSAETIPSHLKVIDNEGVRNQLVQLLPTTANGETNICAGVQTGFQVLGGDDGATNGDEGVLLTDGEDSGISSCFSEVEQSGAVIHTIALGPDAAAELEQMSTLTVSGNDDIGQQSVQASPWNYGILNPGIEQDISIIVTSRAADEKVPLVTVDEHISEKDSVGGRTIYAEVSQRFSPVLFANVTVIIERPTGPTTEQELSDDGLGETDNVAL
ncbi:hypothetical protein chiPu_0018802 [Chiloscyllium punctatum]|uniref:VWFA domain-containing protein n=1 Tax=Chiloscyllium punctatum TaxID=137246 RepID=A0A401RPW7_CHIPU|nr:hypothetical protein [Chiloscyllium punctatum]